MIVGAMRSASMKSNGLFCKAIRGINLAYPVYTDTYQC